MVTVSLIIDTSSCNKQWTRSVDFILYILFLAVFAYVYLRLSKTAKASASIVFQEHEQYFQYTVVVISISLVVRAAICFSYLILWYRIGLIQWTNIINSAIIVLPIIAYTASVSSDEDCLTCFNRFFDKNKEQSDDGCQNVLFSRFQIRKQISIE